MSRGEPGGIRGEHLGVRVLVAVRRLAVQGQPRTCRCAPLVTFVRRAEQPHEAGAPSRPKGWGTGCGVRGPAIRAETDATIGAGQEVRAAISRLGQIWP